MPIVRRPSQSQIAVDGAGFPEPPPPEESGAFAVPRRQTVKMSAVSAPRSESISSFPPPNELPSLVVPPPSPPPSSPTGNRPSVKRNTAKMAAVKGPTDDAPPSGRMLDDVDFADVGRVALELSALPAGRAQALGRPKTPLATPRTPLSAITPPGSGEVIRKTDAVDPRRPGIFAFAGFGLPPDSITGAPSYALRVLVRKGVLREGLAVARRQRSVDVHLYEAALRMADREAYVKGLFLLGAAALLVVALLVGVVAVAS